MEAGFWMVLVSVATSSRLVPFLLLSSGHGKAWIRCHKQHKSLESDHLALVCLSGSGNAVLVRKNSGDGGQVCDSPETP